MKFKTSPIKPFGMLIEPTDNSSHLGSIQIEHLRELIRDVHLLVLRGFHTFQDTKTFSNYCELWGEISIWPFGKVLELIEQEAPVDHIFDHRYVPLHWDGMYRPQIPEFQIFHCVKAPRPGQGGRTTFSNTITALKNASLAKKSVWHKVIGSYKRKMEFYQSKITSPIITKHPYRNVDVIRYNEPHFAENGQLINPPDQKFIGISEAESVQFHCGLKESLYDSRNFYAHEWKKNDVVIADNFSLLHGREVFVSKSPRHLQRVHILSNPPFENRGLEPLT